MDVVFLRRGFPQETTDKYVLRPLGESLFFIIESYRDLFRLPVVVGVDKSMGLLLDEHAKGQGNWKRNACRILMKISWKHRLRNPRRRL
jgi:hypothetical protein